MNVTLVREPVIFIDSYEFNSEFPDLSCKNKRASRESDLFFPLRAKTSLDVQVLYFVISANCSSRHRTCNETNFQF